MTDNPEMETPAVPDEHLSRRARIMARFAARANSAETGFLTLLRYSALVFAALTLIISAGLLVYGAVQQIGRTRVDPAAVALAADDVMPAAGQAWPGKAVAQQKVQRPTISAELRKRTLAIYQARFKPFQRTDTKITEQEAVDFVWSDERITLFDRLSGQQLIGKDEQPLADRNAIMLDALALVDTASATGEFRKQLTAYRDAKKVNVCTDEVRTRTRTISSWDSYATHCPFWYNSPIGCSSSREVDEPYIEKVCSMKFPENLESPAQQFAGAIQRYGDVAGAKLTAARNAAEEQTARNHARKLGGIGHITTSGTLFLVFLGVMFLYLFVAMERHHRALRRLIDHKDS